MKNNAPGVVVKKLPLTLAIASALLCMQQAGAVEAELGDFKLKWNNTIKYSTGLRLEKQDPALVDDTVNGTLFANPGNYNEGDKNFKKGLISNRLELFSEMDLVSSDGYGMRLSGLAYGDSKYTHAKFDQATVKYHGRNAEFRDAFIFGKTEIADMPLTVRLGQHGLMWGESLFFANNAIAGAQSAFDLNRFLSDPTAQAKEFVLPVPQISAQFQAAKSLSFGAYYQFKYQGNRIPGVGSYFSVSDVVGPGGGRMGVGRNPTTGAVRFANHDADMEAKDSGQFGFQTKFRMIDTDFGLYAIRFHDKDPVLVTRLIFDGTSVRPGSYYIANHEGITAYGASANHSFGDANVAIEASVRNNQPLATAGGTADTSGLPVFMHPGTPTNNSDNPAYPLGRTAHVNTNLIWALTPSFMWQEAVLVTEAAYTRLLQCSKNCDKWDGISHGALDPNATKNNLSVRAVFEPTYRQVMSGLDLGVPVGFGYTPKQFRSILGPNGYPASGGGDVTIGLNSVYAHTWRINLAYTKYLGKAKPLQYTNEGNNFSYGQTRADRDFLSLTVRYSL